VPPENPAYTLQRLRLSEKDAERYYYGYSNRVLWPLCHGGIWKAAFTECEWQQYRDVNEKFAKAVIEQADSGALIWFQDYHLVMAPQLVRSRASEAFLMHFWHIAWPDWDTFRACPQHRDLLLGLLGNDLIGFHVERYCQNFIDCVAETFEEAFVDRNGSRIYHNGHETHVAAFPMGVNAERIDRVSRSTDLDFWSEFRRTHGIVDDTQVALGVDRVDYTKGILERLAALERLWETRPEWQEQLTFVQKATESRSLIPDYENLQQRVHETINCINNRFGTERWQPIIYINTVLPQEELYGLYRHSDVLLVSAIRDGMNLVAKEYAAAQVNENGMLVLSDQTGAHEQLGDSALTINPHDTEGFTATIENALTMTDSERRKRMSHLRQQIETHDVFVWMDEIFETADTLRDNDSVIGDE